MRAIHRHARLLLAIAGCSEIRSPPSIDHFGTSSTGASSSDTAEIASTGATPDVAESPSLAACQAYCARRQECGSTIDPYLCEQACIDELLAELELVDCPAAHAATLQCTAGLACGELDAPADHGCAEQVAAQTAACDASCQLTSTVTDPAAMICSAVITCGQTERTLECSNDGCTCAVAGETVATCTIEPDCVMFVMQIGSSWWWSTVSACCGWSEDG